METVGRLAAKHQETAPERSNFFESLLTRGGIVAVVARFSDAGYGVDPRHERGAWEDGRFLEERVGPSEPEHFLFGELAGAAAHRQKVERRLIDIDNGNFVLDGETEPFFCQGCHMEMT